MDRLPLRRSKAAATHYTRNLLPNWALRIRANCIAPGVMLTPVSPWLRIAARQLSEAARLSGVVGEPEDCACVVEFLVTDLSRYVTGQCISVCGGAALTAA